MKPKKQKLLYDYTFRELCDSLDITPYQRVKLGKWFFRKKVLKGRDY